MARPKKDFEDKKFIRSYTTNRNLHKEVADKAKSNGITVTSVINQAFNNFLEEDGYPFV